MPSTKPRVNVWIPQSVKPWYGHRDFQVIYIEPSTAPTKRLREDDEAARKAQAKLEQKKQFAQVDALPDETKALIEARGGDVAKLELEELRSTVNASIPPAVLWAQDYGPWMQVGRPLTPEQVDYCRLQMMKFQERNRTELELLGPLALQADAASEYTFQALFRSWLGDKVKASAREYERTAKVLEQCFPRRDFRTITPKEAWTFADFMHAKKTGPSAQLAHIANARVMYKAAGRDMADKANPFADVTPIDTYEAGEREGFTPKQLRNLLAIVERERWGDNHIEKRHEAALWLLRVAAYTGCRINEAASLTKADVLVETCDYTDDSGQQRSVDVPHIVIRMYKEQKKGTKKAKPKRVPLHPDIASGFMSYAQASKEEAVFWNFPDGGDNGRARWIVREFPKLLRKYAAQIGDMQLVDGKACDRDGNRLTQHCIRHAFIAAVRTARLPADSQRAFVGHAKGDKRDVHVVDYDTPAGLHVLFQDMCTVRPLG